MSYRDRLHKLEKELSLSSASSIDNVKSYLPYAIITLLSIIIIWVSSPSYLKEKRPGSKGKKINYVKFMITVVLLTVSLGVLYYMYGSTLLSKYLK